MRFISWPNTDPAHSLSTLSPKRYRSGPKTRYEASSAELPRWSFHPLEIMSFSCRTQIKDAHSRIDGLTARLMPAEEAEPGQKKQHDAEILASLPGVGRTVLATLLAEASDALQRRDYAALRSLAGVAPVTKRSGKSCVVVRRQACHDRLANAVYHWSRVAVQHDPRSRAKYAELRRRGHSHGRALRSVADRLLNVACAMLKSGAAFNPSSAAQKPA
jgi:transposase